MKISGFTFVRNVIKYDYPVLESLHSILPIVDEFIINVGMPDEDGTLDLIKSIKDPKIKIIQSQWNPNMNRGGYLYAQQTNIAMFNCTGQWAFYIQVDEVVHEKGLALIRECAERYVDDERVDGLALDELTFWGDYNTLIDLHPASYSKRCWIVKPHHFVLSRGDASGFCVHPKYKERGRRIRVADSGAKIYHYTYIKIPEKLTEKLRSVSQYWEGPIKEQMKIYQHDFYNYQRAFLKPFDDSHPKIMEERIKKYPLTLDLSSPLWLNNLSLKDRWKILKTKFVKRFNGFYLDRGSYKLIK